MSRYENVTLPVANRERETELSVVEFDYVNWRGDDHHYVIQVEAVAYGKYDAAGIDRNGPENWVIHGMVVTRDGSARPEMGSSRRRTFLLSKIRDPKEVE